MKFGLEYLQACLNASNDVAEEKHHNTVNKLINTQKNFQAYRPLSKIFLTNKKTFYTSSLIICYFKRRVFFSSANIETIIIFDDLFLFRKFNFILLILGTSYTSWCLANVWFYHFDCAMCKYILIKKEKWKFIFQNLYTSKILVCKMNMNILHHDQIDVLKKNQNQKNMLKSSV